MGDTDRPRFVVPVQGGRARRAGLPGHGRAVRAPGTDPQFRAYFEHAPVGVALSTPDGRFTDVNPHLRVLLGGTGIDLDGAGLADLARYLPDGHTAQRWNDALAEVLAGRIPVARADLTIAPPGVPPRWVRATTALAVLDGHRCLVSHLEDTTPRRLAEHRLARLARRDGLTGLACRGLLADHLAAAADRDDEAGLRTGVLYLDLDGFQRINDEHGYEVGDRVLVAVADRLTRLLHPEDTAGRIGGDEFALIVPGLPGPRMLGEFARRVDRRLAEPLTVGPADLRTGTPALQVRIAASVGATLTRPGDTLDAALRRADHAMFLVKHRRRSAAAEAGGRGVDLPGAGPPGAGLPAADLPAADLGGADVREADLREAPAPETRP